MTSHEIGVDTFYVHALSTSISTFGVAGWILHPSSFFGLYPYSYPSAQPFILSGLSQSLGISLEHTILLFSICLGILGVLSSYILAKEIFDDEVYSFLGAFLYSIAPNFVQYTYWQASSRSMFLAILPLIIWLFIRCGNKFKHKYVILSLMALIFLLATHRTTILLTLTIFTYIITFFLSHIIEKIKHLIPENTNIHTLYILVYLSSFLYLIQFTEFGFININDYYTGFLFNGEDSVTALLNMAVDYTGKYGIFLFFSVVGFIKLAHKTNKNFGEMLVLINLIALLPFMGMENYSPLVLAPFALMLVAEGILTIMNVYKNHVKWKNGIIILINLIIISSTLFSIFMVDHWELNKDTLSEETVASADFIKDTANGAVIANSGDLASKITAFSAVPTIPLGGPYAEYAPPNQIAYGFVKPEDISVRPLDLSEIRPSTDTFYSLTKAPNAGQEWRSLMGSDYSSEGARKTLAKYNANLLIEIGNSQVYYYWVWRPSQMLTSLHDSGNRIYTSGENNIYNLY